jgi:hypothetical protein
MSNAVSFDLTIRQANNNGEDDAMDDEEEFFLNSITQFQSKRMDDQRCSLAIVDNNRQTRMSNVDLYKMVHFDSRH